ncbi:DUF3857 domain-containing protein [Leptolyngbya sp. 7M]|uniref:DUF3857 domain-containing protein n=1 Tax=Leptolyngbya sp. 7M TaxID=2812896 RepID=UPI001B8C45BC|nr:DUF3857 domain-containing protein [Leptolyngbya sp. 7M]QYO67284.1 DUF3857 domain-containing protein [Leptolyngbya sp. 7M]
MLLLSYPISRSIFVALSIVLFTFSVAAQKVPQWLTQAATQQTPAYDIRNVPAVVLLNEESVNISSDGTIVRTVRHAVRILEREGRREAVGRVIYQTDTDKVKGLESWLIRRNGQVKAYGKKEMVDLALVDNDLYNEARQSMIVARDDADVGDVFGFESVLEEKSIFSQFHFSFQYNLPVLSSRFTLNMPSGWRAESVTFNTKRIEPTITAGSHVWQMADLKPIRPEPRSPRLSSMVPRIAVSIFPETPTATRLRTFSNWNDVATWMASIEDPQVIMSPQLTAKAKELTENASNEFEKIRAISRYVQNIQYISIQIGTGRGGGYTPRSSAEVFARSYGDCKDKANLMRAMLRAVGIDSYLVSITADDPDYVRAEWASPHQFNHCIIAIKIGDQTLVESVVTHPTLGRLLIFDPTDPYTPIGDLPEDQQGSLALIDHKDTQELTRMPVLSADANRMERVIEATLMPDGSIKGSVTERTTGQPARQERSQMKNLSREDYTRVIDRWISRGAAGATTSNIVTADNHDDGRFDLKVDFSARSYAQLMQDRLMVFRPAIIGRLDRLTFGDGRRMTPYMIDASRYTEKAKIKLPENFEVDEIPESAKFESEFGRYDVFYKIEDGHLHFIRSLELKRARIAPEKYDSVERFFGRILSIEQSPVVLLRK